jgi:hypothetical protein
MSTQTLSLRSLVLGSSVVVALSAAGCCMGGSSTPTAPIPTLPTLPVAAPVAAAGTQLITLGAGFVPDPTTVSTTAGGAIAANTMATPDVYCAGNIGAMSNVTLTTTTPIASLRVLVRSASDTTLMVRLSDGRVICDDDGGGYPNPAITSDFPAGVHQIYVGSFHTGETPAATVAFTTNPAVMNAALP